MQPAERNSVCFGYRGVLEKKNAPLGDFKAKVYLEDSDEPLLFVIEVRSNGEKRFVNHFMEIVMRQDDKTHYIFMAPYISEQSARAMKEENAVIWICPEIVIS